MSPPIHPLASSQGAVFLINSRQADFRCGPSCEGQAISLSYGCFFAEFLGDLSLVRLRLLDETTCVGLRYGSPCIMLRDFSWKRAFLHLFRLPETFSLFLNAPLKAGLRIFLKTILKARTSNPIMREEYCASSSHRMHGKSRNINRVSIASGVRHRLRPD